MKNSILKSIVLLILFSVTVTSCFKDLDTKPRYGFNSEEVYKTTGGYKSVLAKLYAGFSTTGNDGPAGSADLGSADEGFSQYTRVLWNLQELPTDEAVCGWTDIGIADLDQNNWTSESPWVRGMYNRIYFIVALSNEFIRQSSDSKLSERGFTDEQKNEIRMFKTEARFLRSLAYYHQLDLFGKGPFVTDADAAGNFLPKEGSRVQLFNYVESELKDIEKSLADVKTNEYGRVDKAAAWTLLAKLYLNAEVYIKASRYNECITYCDKVTASSAFSLDADYRWLFLADNNLSSEIIFPVTHDGLFTQSYGGTNFLIHACLDAAMKPKDTFGVDGGWAGLRCKESLVNLFTDSNMDGRFLFFTPGHTLNVDTISLFTKGYPSTKWRNRTRTGAIGSNSTGSFVDTDYPMFRLADVYLMYAEATLRGGSGNAGIALNYVNLIRQRAYGPGLGTVPGIDLDFILAERARELHYEATRRTDLIRYGKFTGGSYLWPFKGGDVNGVSIDSKYDLYPIPVSDLNANPNLTQNPGY